MISPHESPHGAALPLRLSICEWALEATYSADIEQSRDGWAVIDDLIDSALATGTERDIAMHMALTRYRSNTRREHHRREAGND